MAIKKMLPLSEFLKKAYTSTTELDKVIPDIIRSQLENNLRRRSVIQKTMLPVNDLLGAPGDTVYLPTLPDLAAMDDLTEGTDMTPVALSTATSVALTPSERGKVVEVTRKALDRINISGGQEIIDRLGYSATRKLEGQGFALAGGVVPGGSGLTSLYPNGHGSSTVVTADTMSADLIIDAKAALDGNDNIPFEDGYYVLFLHSKQIKSLMKDTDFRDDLRFGNPTPMFTGEIGTYQGFRLVLSNNVTTVTENSVTVYRALAVAPRWAAIAWKRPVELYIDPTLYDGGRKRRFGVLADYDMELIHNDRAFVVKSAEV